MGLSKADIQERIEEGAIRTIVSLQVVGKPKEHVEKSVEEYLDTIKKEKTLEVLRSENLGVEELEDDDEGFFSGLAEIELLVPNLEALTQIAFNLTPASIEIIEPTDFMFDARQLQNWVNDLLALVHTLATNLRGERQRANYLNSAIVRLSQNTLTLALMSGPKKIDVLKRLTGLEEKALEKVLEQMKKDAVVKKDGEEWILKSSEK